jgi:ribosomal protein S1
VQEPIDTLRPGDVRTAEIIGIHLYHGAVIDLGTQFHGMIPVNELQWPQVVDTLTLERHVKVRVHAVRPSHPR